MKPMGIRRPLPHGLYGMTSEEHSRDRTNLEVAAAMLEGGVRVLQYREKSGRKSLRQMVEECRVIRRMTRVAGTLLIINDHVDIALLVEADGVHVGQNDLTVADVRRLVGTSMLIGLSTHSPEQARQAYREGADYIGIGPIFQTGTKPDVVDPIGLECLDYVVRHIPLPAVAIGGITLKNLQRVIDHGARTVCMVSEIVGATDIPAAVRRANYLIGP